MKIKVPIFLSNHYKIIALILYLFMIIDSMLTYIQHEYELNPIMLILFQTVGIIMTLFVIKLSLSAILVYWAYKNSKYGLISAFVIMGIVVFNNLFAIVIHR